MPAHLPATELIDRPPTGRIVTRSRPVRLGDVDQQSRLRLDATARYLQDIATDDATDTELGDAFGWVVRRTLIEVHRAASLDERLDLATFCSGTGRSWAERRTSINGTRGASIEAVSLWIRVDPSSGRPTGLGDDFLGVYGAAAAGRRVSSRLRLPSPTEQASSRPWAIRQVDLDPLRHVNNAAQWAVVEETLPGGSRRGVGEIEHLGAVEADRPLHLMTSQGAEGIDSWLVADGSVLTAARWTPAR